MTVFCLPMTEADCGWRAVIININRETHLRSRLAWMHPQCLRALPNLGARPQLDVHHTEKRGMKKASIDIGPEQPGVRTLDGRLILDARWRFAQGREDLDCTGHCLELCESLATHELSCAMVIEFAERIRNYEVGHICCVRGKHRSVAAANILQICFNLAVNMDCAARERCHKCCNRRVIDNAASLFQAFRRLPQLAIVHARSLPHTLRLPA